MPVLPGDQGKFDAFAHGVDAFGADADAVAKMPGEFGEFAAATAAARTALSWAAEQSDHRVIAFAIDDSSAGGFLERSDRQEAFHEDVQKFDEAAEFLNRDDERIVLFAEMLLHELRALPIHEFAFGESGAAFVLGAFRGDFLELQMRIESRFGIGRSKR